MFKIANTINELVVSLLNLKHYLECSVCQFMIVRIYLNESVGTLQHILSDKILQCEVDINSTLEFRVPQFLYSSGSSLGPLLSVRDNCVRLSKLRAHSLHERVSAPS